MTPEMISVHWTPILKVQQINVSKTEYVESLYSNQIQFGVKDVSLIDGILQVLDHLSILSVWYKFMKHCIYSASMAYWNEIRDISTPSKAVKMKGLHLERFTV